MSGCTTQQLVQRTAEELAGKYLTFILGTESYGLEILKVREIIGYMEITAVPRMPGYIKGVINLRGQVIPVVDMRAKFDMSAAEVTEQSCIIVVEVTQDNRSCSVGIAVDQVSEVQDITGDLIEQAPHFDDAVDISFLLGMAKINNEVKLLLNIDKVLEGMNHSTTV